MTRGSENLGDAFFLCFMVWCLFVLSGCGGTTHTIQTNGQEGMSLGNGTYLFPDGAGALKAGPLTSKQPPAGVLIRNPKTQTEVLEWLKKQGVQTRDGEAPIVTFTEAEKEKIGTWREEQPEAVEKILRVMAGKGELNAADRAILNQYVKK